MTQTNTKINPTETPSPKLAGDCMWKSHLGALKLVR
jgi:hypothetical protein